MAIQKKIYTSEEFWDFVHLPENAARFFERLNGEIVERIPSNPYSSEIGGNIGYFIKHYLMSNPIARVTPADGGYDVTDEDTFAPDVAVILISRQAQFPRTGFNRIPPDIAIEVVSPSDIADPKRRIQRKLETYKEIRIPLVWYVYTDPIKVEVYKYGKLTDTFGIDGILDGGDILPDFKLRIRDIFPD